MASNARRKPFRLDQSTASNACEQEPSQKYKRCRQSSLGIERRLFKLALVVMLSALVAWLSIAKEAVALKEFELSSHSAAHQRPRHSPPTIYSYSASELNAPGPISSHRLNKPYSWTNQRLAKLTDAGDEVETNGWLMSSTDSSIGGDRSSMMGEEFAMQQRKHHQSVPAKPSSRWPARGANRRRTSSSAAKGSRNGVGKTKARPSSFSKTRPSPPLAHAPQPDFQEHETASDNATVAPGNRRSGKRKNLVCYYGTWAVYRPDAGKFAVENIDPFLCTHVIYGFTGLSYDNLIKPLDPWNDLEDNYGKGAMKRFTNLKRINPDLKTLVAIGGWNEGSIKYSKMASDPEARARFVESVLNFLERFNFDGLDLDWEYPGSRGGAAHDKQNFVKLLGELSAAFKPRQYLLTAAVSAGKWFIDPAYDIAQVSRYLDLINLMAYDYHGGWETKTGMNAPLFSSRQFDLTREEQMLNVNWSVNYWLSMGAAREKLMLGVGSYGRSFTLDKQQVNGINAPASQKGRAGPYTREPGSLGYNELCEAFKSAPRSWTIVRDADYLAPYAFNQERQWVGYDDRQSLALKAQFAKSMGLGGVMMWSIETDDFRGSCHGEKFPLLNTIKRVLEGGEVVVVDGGDQPTTARPPPTGSSTRRPATVSTPRPIISVTSSTTTSTTTRRPGHEIEEEAATSSTRRPQTSRPSVSPSTSRRPATSRPTAPTTTSTTTERPASEQAEFTCSRAGMFADPRNCRKFLRCVQMGSRLQLYKFDCGPGTAFNEQQQYCDHIYNIPACSKADKQRTSSDNEVGASNDDNDNNNHHHHTQGLHHPVSGLHLFASKSPPAILSTHTNHLASVHYSQGPLYFNPYNARQHHPFLLLH